jgi:hypothetical protein
VSASGRHQRAGAVLFRQVLRVVHRASAERVLGRHDLELDLGVLRPAHLLDRLVEREPLTSLPLPRSGALAFNLGATLARVAVAFVIAMALGSVIGLIMAVAAIAKIEENNLRLKGRKLSISIHDLATSAGADHG